jgi:2-oxoglutarate ferredoxin oxidoreductase subunit gamma
MYSQIMEKIGNPVVLNICMLGALIRLRQIVKPESIMKVLETRLPANFMQMNRNALELGISLGESALQ